MKKSPLLCLVLALLLVCCFTAAFAAAPKEAAPHSAPSVPESAETAEPTLAEDEILRAKAQLEQSMANHMQDLERVAAALAQSDSALTEEARREQLRQSLEQSFRELYEIMQERSGTPVDSALQSTCTHPVEEISAYHYTYRADDGQTHEKTTSATVACRDCKAFLRVELISIKTERHSWAGSDCSLCPYSGA